MPRVKFDYIVSFSSEDPEHPASNLLAGEVSKKKWLCSKGEPSCSVVVQLARAVQISAVHIGAYHAALVEVLVGRSEKPNDQFEVLVPSSVFLTPAEARRDANVERVRSFSGDQLAAARHSRWDRLRIVCTQPYNKHCQYGLSFVHVTEPEGAAPAAAVPHRLLALEPASSDEDEFRPGELFAKHKAPAATGTTTDAQIRQATSQALKNIADSAAKLTKKTIERADRGDRIARHDTIDPPDTADRRRASLLYSDEDARPNARIDRVVDRHNDEKAKEAKKHNDNHGARDKSPGIKKNDTKNFTDNDIKPQRMRDDSKTKHRDSSKDKEDKTSRNKVEPPKDKVRENRKRQHPDEMDKKGPPRLRAGPVSDSPHTLLRGVVLALSGYQHPRRGSLRDQALALGARYERDWGPRCTHLVCAFPNTPKLKTVRSSANGDTAVVVTGEWVEQCCARRRLLPWQWFATEPHLRRDPEPDSDDEAKKPRQSMSPSPSPSPSPRDRSIRSRSGSHSDGETRVNLSHDSDVAFVRDERYRGHVTLDDSDATDCENMEPNNHCAIDASKSLPDLFEGRTFVLSADLSEPLAAQLVRYVRAYGGLVLKESQIASESGVDYLLCASEESAGAATKLGASAAVRADWVWRCHEDRRLCPVAEYAL